MYPWASEKSIAQQSKTDLSPQPIVLNIMLIHKEKQRGCPLLGANRYTHTYISYICVYVLFICLRL